VSETSDPAATVCRRDRRSATWSHRRAPTAFRCAPVVIPVIRRPASPQHDEGAGVVGVAAQVGVEMNAHRALRNDELPLPARNAQFATSVERFLGLEHVGRHCLAAPLLGL
jgi:hypothetical protein